MRGSGWTALPREELQQGPTAHRLRGPGAQRAVELMHSHKIAFQHYITLHKVTAPCSSVVNNRRRIKLSAEFLLWPL